ncbi:MAG: glycosyltransferase [Roseivirga sp.]|nr:glycosyltransferase [Roseivirga sp.]
MKTLTENGHQLRLIYFEPEDWWKTPMQGLGVDIVRIADSSKRGRIKKVYRLIKKEKFDIIQALHYHMNPYVAVLALMLGAKSVGAFRGDGERELLTVNKHIRNLAFRLGSAFICNSRSTIKKLSAIRNLTGKLHYLPNVVEVPGAISINEHDLPTRFLAVNSLVGLKRVDRILNFIARYKKHNPLATLKILGDGPMRGELESIAEALEINEQVTLEGQVDNVADYYQEADVFLLASESEGTPNVILEAMSYGKVVVSSKVGEAAHLLREGECGLLVDFDNDQDLENICARLSTDWPELKRKGLQAYNQVQQHHGYSHLYTNINRIYREL